MQRVTNCVLRSNGKILLLKKPRRGWYAIPGGKMEQGETIKEAVIREFREETALHIQNPKLAGAFTFTICKGEKVVKEWMMFTFTSDAYDGELTDHCVEGELKWVPIDRLKELPMAEGDHQILAHILGSEEMLFGNFTYTEDYQLLDSRLDPPNL